MHAGGTRGGYVGPVNVIGAGDDLFGILIAVLSPTFTLSCPLEVETEEARDDSHRHHRTVNNVLVRPTRGTVFRQIVELWRCSRTEGTLGHVSQTLVPDPREKPQCRPVNAPHRVPYPTGPKDCSAFSSAPLADPVPPLTIHRICHRPLSERFLPLNLPHPVHCVPFASCPAVGDGLSSYSMQCFAHMAVLCRPWPFVLHCVCVTTHHFNQSNCVRYDTPLLQLCSHCSNVLMLRLCVCVSVSVCRGGGVTILERKACRGLWAACLKRGEGCPHKDLRSRRWVERGLLSPARRPRQGQSIFFGGGGGGVYETSVPRGHAAPPGVPSARRLPCPASRKRVVSMHIS